MSFIETLAQVVGILGAGAIVTSAVVAVMGKMFLETFMRKSVENHERDLERLKQEYQIDLEGRRTIYKKSELIFEKQFSAANRFLEIRLQYIQAPWAPDLEYQDFVERFIDNHDKLQKDLQLFLRQFGAILSNEDREQVEKLIQEVLELGFHATCTHPGQNADIVDSITSKIKELEANFIAQVIDQAGPPIVRGTQN